MSVIQRDRELGAAVLRAVGKALELEDSTVAIAGVSRLLEQYEAGALSRTELFQQLERTL